MGYFCLSSSSQPSSRCIINVENPPSAHALRRHEDNDFHLHCAPVITNSSVVFVSHFLPFQELARSCFSLMVVFIFYTAGSLENGADLYPPSVSLCPTAGDLVLILPAGCVMISTSTPTVTIRQKNSVFFVDCYMEDREV